MEVSRDHPAISLSPPRVVIDTRPGSTQSFNLIVTNSGPSPTQLTLSTIELAAAHDPDSFVDPDRERAHRLAARWLTPAVTTLSIGPGEQVTVPVTLAVPSTARPGTHAAAVELTQLLAPAPSGSGVNVVAQASVATEVLVTLPGAPHHESTWTLDGGPRVVMHRSGVVFSARLRNDGDVVVRDRVRLDVTSIAGDTARGRPVDVLALPDGRRRVRMHWNDVPWIGLYRPTLHIQNAQGSRSLTYPTVLVLPPWWMLALLGASIILPLWLRRRNR